MVVRKVGKYEVGRTIGEGTFTKHCPFSTLIASRILPLLNTTCPAKHGELCKALSAIYCKIMLNIASLETARARSKSGIQAIHSLHVVQRQKHLPVPKPPTKWETFAKTKGIFSERWLCEMLTTYKFVSCSKSEGITPVKLRSHAIQKVV